MSFQIVKKNGLLILSILYLVGCGTGTVISKDGVTSDPKCMNGIRLF